MGVAVAIAVAAAAILALTRGNAGDGIDDGPWAVIFTVESAVGVSTTAEVADAAYDADAARVGHDLADLFSTFFGRGFLANVGEDEPAYDTALAPFAPEALAAAREQLQVLTLGDLAPRFSAVTALPGTIRVRVLFDPDGTPTLAVATVAFEATATPVDGGASATLASGGDYFLEPAAGGWHIVAFSVDRSDTGVPAAVAS